MNHRLAEPWLGSQMDNRKHHRLPQTQLLLSLTMHLKGGGEEAQVCLASLPQARGRLGVKSNREVPQGAWNGNGEPPGLCMLQGGLKAPALCGPGALPIGCSSR
jgi:hypothetical protein